MITKSYNFLVISFFDALLFSESRKISVFWLSEPEREISSDKPEKSVPDNDKLMFPVSSAVILSWSFLTWSSPSGCWEYVVLKI